ncbi:MAG: cytochrome C [Candidatus Contendobacter odensis]|uniref:Cytochrome C n=1 Tax=Candidatus Contendibacter odensensis TaxID=1400860 RepID=A0A2G6PF52_9GAMM|nr:MAG: cytochrome C [Candidatus Contendobacter odensis]
MNKYLRVYLIGGLIGLGTVITTNASSPRPEEAVHYRQSVFTITKWNFIPIGAMVRGKIPFDAAAVARHAQYIEMMSNAALEGFPKGTGPDVVKDTEALPEIWAKREKFEAAMTDFQQASSKLAEAARSGDEKAIKAQFGKTAKTCKACHKAFRKD